MTKNLKELRVYASPAEEATITALAGPQGTSAYLKELVQQDAATRGVIWPGDSTRRGKRPGQAQLVALWIYEGSSPNGEDCPRKGDFKLAQAAFNYWSAYGDTPECQRVAPSQARVKAERSDFGRVYAFRIVDAQKVQRWNVEQLG